MRAALHAAATFEAAAQAILALGARWAPDALARLIGDGLELAALQGREAVFLDAEPDTAFADADVFNQPFKEQIEFFRQKRAKPTKAWTDAMRGVHDRAFVIAGATDLAMLSDFQTALAEAMEKGTTLEQFRHDFDRIVEKYGWQYRGNRGWRTRVIYEQNMRTAYMAGRLKQMRDPDVMKLRPFWQYRHGETRKPKIPRPQHVAWHGKIFRCDDPFWEKHFPPNDWLCSCGVRSLSLRDLKRMGKEGPDVWPGDLFEPVTDPLTGKLVEQPQGIGYGWDYMPGDLWERGLVPSALIDAGQLVPGRMAVAIDEPAPIADLISGARPFKAKPLPEGLTPEDYVGAFLKPFGASIGRAVLFRDAAGNAVPISDELFRDRAGKWKVMKRERNRFTPLIAEAVRDPDEIWLGVARKVDPADRSEELVVDRRYIRVDPATGLIIVFEIGERLWEAVTAYQSSLKGIDLRRGGKLLFKRKGRE